MKNKSFKIVRKFLEKYSSDDLDYINEYLIPDNYPNYNDPYFVYMAGERCGCMASDQFFCSAEKVNKLIKEQLSGEFGVDDKWDVFIILDINKNEQIVPKI